MVEGQGAHIPAPMVRTVATHEAGSWAEHSPHLSPFIPSVRSSLLPLYPFYGGANGGSVWGQVLGVLETCPSSHRGCRRGKAALGLSDSRAGAYEVGETVGTSGCLGLAVVCWSTGSTQRSPENRSPDL